MAHTIRQLGRPKEFRLPDGRKITVREKIWIDEVPGIPNTGGRFIPCAPYFNHAIYETGDTVAGTLPYKCTCGSPAVIVGFDAYKRDASEQGLMFVCLIHAQTGKHATGSI